MKLIAVLVILAFFWLGRWASNTGILVTSADSKIPKTRECSYFIGVSVLKRLEPLADRCPLIRRIGT
jgi:uncharacterized membrane protein (DUF106 family)